jgi:hypothetical protein
MKRDHLGAENIHQGTFSKIEGSASPEEINLSSS